jgi:pyridoxamine 5'-phosphate oxidase
VPHTGHRLARVSDLSRYPRTDYDGEGVDASTVAATPWLQIRTWVTEAVAAAEVTPGFAEPTAVSVATVDATGLPNVRTVLARFLDDRGPGFVSSLHSTKAAEIAASPHVALAYTWPGLFRAIRFRGVAEPIADDELLTYWRTRPYGSQIAACASLQSHPIDSRAALEEAFAEWERALPRHRRGRRGARCPRTSAAGGCAPARSSSGLADAAGSTTASSTRGSATAPSTTRPPGR